MLEYPLWYIYFLTVFSLILSLTPSYPKDVSDGPLSTRIRQWAGGIAALSILIGMANLSWEYQNLTQYSREGKPTIRKQFKTKSTACSSSPKKALCLPITPI